MSINKIVFDFGGVLCDFRFKEHLLNAGYSNEEVEYLNKNVFNGPEIEIAEGTGKITRDEVFQILYKKFPEKAGVLKFIQSSDLRHILPLRPNVIEYTKELRKQGFKVYGLSNLSKAAHDTFKQQYAGFDDLFDGLTASYLVGAIKPHSHADPDKAGDTTIYKRFFKDNNIVPSTALFIDDKECNIKMSQALGMAGIQWTDTDTLETIKAKVTQAISRSKLDTKGV